MGSRNNALFFRTFLGELFTTGLLRTLGCGFLSGLIVVPLFEASGMLDTPEFWTFLCVAWVIIGAVVSGLFHLDAWLAYRGVLRTDDKLRAYFGARELSLREQRIIAPVLEQIEDNFGRNLPAFEKIYVIDAATASMFSVGSMLFVSSESIRSDYFAPLFAHELGHLQNGDSATLYALLRFLLQFKAKPSADMLTTGQRAMLGDQPLNLTEQFLKHNMFLSKPRETMSQVFLLLMIFRVGLSTGGGVRGNAKSWAKYFREQDFEADRFSAEAGYESQLYEYLEQVRFLDSSVPDDLALQPPVEQRMERLNERLLR